VFYLRASASSLRITFRLRNEEFPEKSPLLSHALLSGFEEDDKE